MLEGCGSPQIDRENLFFSIVKNKSASLRHRYWQLSACLLSVFDSLLEIVDIPHYQFNTKRPARLDHDTEIFCMRNDIPIFLLYWAFFDSIPSSPLQMVALGNAANAHGFPMLD